MLLTAGRADGYLGVEDVFAVRWLEGVAIRWRVVMEWTDHIVRCK